MATIYAIHSVTVEDADGDRVAIPLYVTFSDAATWTSILAAMAAETVLIDAITEGKVVGQSLSVQPALPGGLKANAVANSDVEKTGSLTYNSDAPNSKAVTVDIPAFLQSEFAGDTIPSGGTNTAALTASLISSAGTFRNKNDDWAYNFVNFRRGKKSSRKHR